MSQPRATGVAPAPSEPDDASPGATSKKAAEEAGRAADEAYDHALFPYDFYRGLIVFLDSTRGRGLVRSYSGREIPFEFPFVHVIGAGVGERSAGIELLRQGDRVGFDVGWTSRGLRVTAIKPLGRAGASE